MRRDRQLAAEALVGKGPPLQTWKLSIGQLGNWSAVKPKPSLDWGREEQLPAPLPFLLFCPCICHVCSFPSMPPARSGLPDS